MYILELEQLRLPGYLYLRAEFRERIADRRNHNSMFDFILRAAQQFRAEAPILFLRRAARRRSCQRHRLQSAIMSMHEPFGRSANETARTSFLGEDGGCGVVLAQACQHSLKLKGRRFT